MYSVKPGRAPSLMGGIAGLFVAGFGVVWIMLALSIGAPWPFAMFGVFFIAMALIGAIYNFRNATQPNRYSSLDITTSQGEPDPLNQKFGGQPSAPGSAPAASSPARQYPGKFCPFCGKAVAADVNYCPNCGKDI